jgi:hypothetical protein
VANPSAEGDGWLGAWHLTTEQACQLAHAFGFKDSTPTDHVAPLTVLEDALREYRALSAVDRRARVLHFQNRKEFDALGRSVRALQDRVARLSPEFRDVLLEGLGDVLARPDSLYRGLRFSNLQNELEALEAALEALKPPPHRPGRLTLVNFVTRCAHLWREVHGAWPHRKRWIKGRDDAVECGPFYDAVHAALRIVEPDVEAPTRIIAETLKSLGRKAPPPRRSSVP